MDSLQNLPFHDHPSNVESFQTSSISNQSLIDLLNGKLAGGVDTIELLPDQVREIIQGLQEPKKFPPTDEPESSATKELTVLKHHCRLGDYTGRVFNDRKLHNTDAPLPKLATELVELLGEEYGAFLGEFGTKFCSLEISGAYSYYLRFPAAVSGLWGVFRAAPRDPEKFVGPGRPISPRSQVLRLLHGRPDSEQHRPVPRTWPSLNLCLILPGS
ncbi:uncharacterized protein BP5553_08515 [Venustampulla echinocandica]|uniref:Uncharacterized protein n=1 Tax=Venustampulla echinocandica TaxID=2656787 RepID=A0A370TEG7_9HELO|nr:uncharacterized protein BP5553_08515 [Venustampulla echinocandica]RDL33076.1 hypothetical protein BP5553_08515 [Venustampulla echinocandica]